MESEEGTEERSTVVTETVIAVAQGIVIGSIVLLLFVLMYLIVEVGQ